MAKSLYVTATEELSGKSAVLLGVMQVILQELNNVVIFRPIINDTVNGARDHDINLVLSHFPLDVPYEETYAYTLTQALGLINSGQQEFLLDSMEFTKKKEPVAIHPTCSTRKMGLTDKMKEVAAKCAEKVLLPPDVTCCGFAGDKGFHLPDLNPHGLRRATPVIKQEGAGIGYSNSRTCEIGCAEQTGIPYMSMMYLVDEVTTPGA